MDRFDRKYRLHGLLSNHHIPISLKQIMERLECSKSTAVRCIEKLRDYLDAPVEYNREIKGYLYNQQSSTKLLNAGIHNNKINGWRMENINCTFLLVTTGN